MLDQARQARQVDPSVNGGHEGYALPAQHRQMQPVGVAVDDVELVRALRDLLEQRGLRDDRVRARPAQSQALRPHRDKPRARCRVAAGEQRDVMAELDEPVDEPGDDALGSAVESRRHAFGQWRNLRNPHWRPRFGDADRMQWSDGFQHWFK